MTVAVGTVKGENGFVGAVRKIRGVPNAFLGGRVEQEEIAGSIFHCHPGMQALGRRILPSYDQTNTLITALFQLRKQPDGFVLTVAGPTGFCFLGSLPAVVSACIRLIPKSFGLAEKGVQVLAF